MDIKKKKSEKPQNKKIVLRLGELFCGPGGLALGAKKASVVKEGIEFKIDHTWATDYDNDSCRTYARNICPEKQETVICKDVRELDMQSLEPIDIFAYGFPCNDFSIVGEKKGFNGTFGPLYSHGVAVLNRFKPKILVAENVGGITSANEGIAFKKILADLRHAGNGYLLTAHLYKFEDYGVPQMRHRVIIVGIDKTLGLTFRIPAPFTFNKPLTAREALEEPPIPEDALNTEKTYQSKTVIERLSHIKPGENAWNSNLPDHLRLNVKSAKMSQIYRRLHPEKPAYTITGSGGGGTHGYHWEELRALTNRERARLQTFPDSFVFEGSKESVRKQIGMAVSPRMSEVIFMSILKTMAGIKYPSIFAVGDAQPELFNDDHEGDTLNEPSYCY